MGSASICRQWVGHVIEDRDRRTLLQLNHETLGNEWRRRSFY